jgi:Cu(I)/Ag(I) efflux system membrane fusion protein
VSNSTTTWPQRLKLGLQIVQVRLRFVVVLLAAFLVVGGWNRLSSAWDALWHRWTGFADDHQTMSADTEYFCPMDPGVVSDWAAICPVCNMDLVRRKRGEAVLLPDGVVARMQFSPYRIQLAGIRTSVVQTRELSRDIRLAGRFIEMPPQKDEPGESEQRLERPGRLVLVCPVDESDVRWLTPGRPARVVLDSLDPSKEWEGTVEPSSPASGMIGNEAANTVAVRLTESDASIRPGTYATALVSIPLREILPASKDEKAPYPTPTGTLAVLATSVIDNGAQKLIYVESMPGMFDGVEVTLGPRCGEYFPVLKGLEPGQIVASVGAFLIDAEARLNPSLAAAYFGANRSSPSRAAPGDGPLTRNATLKRKAKSKLSPADQALVDKQKICPVTDLPLGSMGAPVPVEVDGHRVFICCKGCETRLKQDAAKYLAKLKPQ